jgi:DinB superfamily
MKQILGVLCTVCLLFASTARVVAQSATLNGELLKDWIEMKSTIMKLANEMPADRYVFKTTPPQRDFAQQVLHIAQANVVNLRFLGGKAAEPSIDRSVRSKADVMKAMADSFDYGEALIREQTPASMFEVVQTNAFLGPSSRARVIYFLLGHTWDIYGQMVVYLRENGGVPPASQRP